MQPRWVCKTRDASHISNMKRRQIDKWKEPGVAHELAAVWLMPTQLGSGASGASSERASTVKRVRRCERLERLVGTDTRHGTCKSSEVAHALLCRLSDHAFALRRCLTVCPVADLRMNALHSR